MTRTFFALLAIADVQAAPVSPSIPEVGIEEKKDKSSITRPMTAGLVSGLHYNIQIHLPPTKDIEVYNAIFKALRAHLVDE